MDRVSATVCPPSRPTHEHRAKDHTVLIERVCACAPECARACVCVSFCVTASLYAVLSTEDAQVRLGLAVGATSRKTHCCWLSSTRHLFGGGRLLPVTRKRKRDFAAGPRKGAVVVANEHITSLVSSPASAIVIDKGKWRVLFVFLV